jgi:hypothetical protein
MILTSGTHTIPPMFLPDGRLFATPPFGFYADLLKNTPLQKSAPKGIYSREI